VDARDVSDGGGSKENGQTTIRSAFHHTLGLALVHSTATDAQETSMGSMTRKLGEL